MASVDLNRRKSRKASFMEKSNRSSFVGRNSGSGRIVEAALPVGNIMTNLHILDNIIQEQANHVVTEKERNESKLLDDSTKHLYSTIDALKRQLRVERENHEMQTQRVVELEGEVKEMGNWSKQVKVERAELKNDLASSMGRNAELTWRSKMMADGMVQAKENVEGSKKKNKMVMREISGREEKIRELSKRVVLLSRELETLKTHFVDEKLEKAEMYRQQKLFDAKLKQAIENSRDELKGLQNENSALHDGIQAVEAQLQRQKLVEQQIVEKALYEKEGYICKIQELQNICTSNRIKHTAAAAATLEAAINDERAEKGITLQRFMDENQLLRHRVLHLENENYKLSHENSPADFARRRLEASVKLESNTYQVDLIALRTHVTELEKLLQHSSDQKVKYESLLQASEEMIRRLEEERNLNNLEDFTIRNLNSYAPRSPSKRNNSDSSNGSPRRVKHEKSFKQSLDLSESSDYSNLKIVNIRLVKDVKKYRELTVILHEELEALKAEADEMKQSVVGQLFKYGIGEDVVSTMDVRQAVECLIIKLGHIEKKDPANAILDGFSEADFAAAKIQATLKGNATRALSKKKNQAASKIQAIAKGKRTRKRVVFIQQVKDASTYTNPLGDAFFESTVEREHGETIYKFYSEAHFPCIRIEAHIGSIILFFYLKHHELHNYVAGGINSLEADPIAFGTSLVKQCTIATEDGTPMRITMSPCMSMDKQKAALKMQAFARGNKVRRYQNDSLHQDVNRTLLIRTGISLPCCTHIIASVWKCEDGDTITVTAYLAAQPLKLYSIDITSVR